MRGAIPPLPAHVFMVWCPVKHREKFTFTSLYVYTDDANKEISIERKFQHADLMVGFIESNLM